jgi:hypothetical protein
MTDATQTRRLFRIDREPSHNRTEERPEPRPVAEARKPRARERPGRRWSTPAEIDVFDETDGVTDIPPPVVAKSRRSLWLAAVFFRRIRRSHFAGCRPLDRQPDPRPV